MGWKAGASIVPSFPPRGTLQSAVGHAVLYESVDNVYGEVAYVSLRVGDGVV